MPAAKKGLYANVNAKRDRIAHGSGETMRTPGTAGAPAKDAFTKAAKTAKKAPTQMVGTKKAAAKKAPAKKATAKKAVAKKTVAGKSPRKAAPTAKRAVRGALLRTR